MPFTRNPTPPWKRLSRVPTPLGGSMLVDRAAPRGRLTPAQYGLKCERDARHALFKDGWMVTASKQSRGAADLVATKQLEPGQPAVTKLIQVKGCMSFAPGFCNQGVREILSAPPVWSRETWGFVYERGHVVTIAIAPDGSIAVTGKEPYRLLVEQAIGRMRSFEVATKRRGRR